MLSHHYFTIFPRQTRIRNLAQSCAPRTRSARRARKTRVCRYVAFTYFAPSLQREVLARIVERLLAKGYLVIGTHERLPGEASSLVPLGAASQILQKGANN